MLAALLAAFCGILYQLTRILLGRAESQREPAMPRLCDGVPAMGLMLGALVVFSVWLPAPLLVVMQRAAGIIGGRAMSAMMLVLLLGSCRCRQVCFAWRLAPGFGGNG